MDVNIRKARLSDLKAICRVKKAAAEDLTARHGKGHWSGINLGNVVKRLVQGDTLYVAEIDSGLTLVGTFTIDRVMPYFYDRKWFKKVGVNGFCTVRSMAIDPAHQKKGIGREIMKGIELLARRNRLKSIRLDAYAGPAGAGGFYEKCGYKKVHKGKFRKIELEYFEKVLD